MREAVGAKSVHLTGTGIATGPALTTGNEMRNGAAGAPGETATGMADMTGQQTLGEAGTTGSGPVEIDEIKIVIEGMQRIGTGTAGATSTGADERPAPARRLHDAMEHSLHTVVLVAQQATGY
jgi:hypothetical protein